MRERDHRKKPCFLSSQFSAKRKEKVQCERKESEEREKREERDRPSPTHTHTKRYHLPPNPKSLWGGYD